MMSDLLKLIAYPISFIMIGYGVMTILGGHITPGGGFQGGAMMASGAILCILVYGLKDNPFNLSHGRMSLVESCGALLYICLGLVGLFAGGSFLYNVGTNIYGLVPAGSQDYVKLPRCITCRNNSIFKHRNRCKSIYWINYFSSFILRCNKICWGLYRQ